MGPDIGGQKGVIPYNPRREPSQGEGIGYTIGRGRLKVIKSREQRNKGIGLSLQCEGDGGGSIKNVFDKRRV